MKKLLPLMAAGALLAACGNPCDGGHCDHAHKYDGDRGYYYDNNHDNNSGHISSSDPLSERSMGSVRGAHNEYWENSHGNPDADKDTNYYYVPTYDTYYHGGYWRRY